MGFNVKDELLKKTAACPVSATTAVTSYLEMGTGDFLADCEVKLTAPACTTTQLPDTKVNTFIIEMDDDSAFGSATTLLDAAIVQTGAAGAGAAAATRTFRPPVDVERYIRAKCTATGSADQTANSMILEVLL